MSSEAAIQVRGLSKAFPIYSKPHHRLLQMISPGPKDRWYREFRALRNIDLNISRGETVGIVGRNGSGKSTLLQLICGTLTPSAGEIQVNGRIAALLELGAGFNPEFTGRENVFLNATVLGLKHAEIVEKFDEIAAFADIGDFIDQPVKSYSSGMYVRLAFAVAINVSPEILVVDEALSVGDEGFQRKCFARIDAIRDSGATVLFVSHSASTVVDLCDRAILLDRGELLAQGTPKYVVSRYQKLLYAPTDRVAQIREEIRESSAEAAGASRRLSSHAEPGVVSASDSPSVAPREEESQAYWEEGMVSSSTVVYENRGAVIEDPHLQTLDGNKVNVLVPGGTYVYAYKVRLERALVNVRCGMMIRSITGIEVGGAATSTPQGGVPVVEAGKMLNVRFRFRCLLTPGSYFLSAGVLATLGEGEEYIDRQIDVAMFRVMPAADRLATGFVDLDVVPQLSVAP
ncbi:ABC transporter ATP-binding protein [Rhodanobacter glycinis]|uniref:ABC transporter ATP-binding protein n=1 Tax=Rhodanobacter glycinis TaxID=582702 RepID=UPI00112A524E|nr:ABC transporter ATP-binding protein [Rhodanobacter glycinis]TPG48678.1 ABC transporter ATP-binding protein [Rhodanobacter glycinis]